jgi:hypothetical protein
MYIYIYIYIFIYLLIYMKYVCVDIILKVKVVGI